MVIMVIIMAMMVIIMMMLIVMSMMMVVIIIIVLIMMVFVTTIFIRRDEDNLVTSGPQVSWFQKTGRFVHGKAKLTVRKKVPLVFTLTVMTAVRMSRCVTQTLQHPVLHLQHCKP